MSSEPTTTTTTSGLRPKRVVVPKVWKRPHSTIYGKNVEFGSSLYSDKIGELNGRKFNSELPWTMRNSGTSSPSTSASGHSSSAYSQGYLSQLNNNLYNDNDNNTFVASSKIKYDFTGKATSEGANRFVCLLDVTNPNRLFANKRNYRRQNKLKEDGNGGEDNRNRIDFYDQFGEFSQEIDRVQANCLLATDPLVRRKKFDDNLDFDYTIGIFVPKLEADSASNGRDPSSGRRPKPSIQPPLTYAHDKIPSLYMNNQATDINHEQSSQHHSMQQQQIPPTNYLLQLAPTKLHKPTQKQLAMHEYYGQFGINSSIYGPSADGRKLSLGSINPQSYRPSLPSKTTTAHASDGEEFEFHDRSSPFYTDR